MKKQSVAAPIRAELIADDRFGKAMHKPQVVVSCAYINKGRDKEWYDKRRLERDNQH